jgi:hypothetical protein
MAVNGTECNRDIALGRIAVLDDVKDLNNAIERLRAARPGVCSQGLRTREDLC